MNRTTAPDWMLQTKWTKRELPRAFAGKFGSRSKEVSPLEKFAIWAAGGKPPEGKLIDVPSIWLCEADYKRLKEITLQWIKKYHYPPRIYRVARSVEALEWHCLSIAPSCFGDIELEGIQPGQVYFESENIYRPKDKEV
jgi:hypothetical protein